MEKAILDYLHQHLQLSHIQLKKLDKGLTNQNYLLVCDQGRFMLRWPNQDAAHIVDRHHEALALKALDKTGLDVPLFYFDEHTGVKLSHYIEDLKTFTETDDPNRVIKAAELMRTLHGLKLNIAYNFDPIQRYLNYRSHVSDPLISDQEAQSILDAFKESPRSFILCHNDWVAGNIGFSQEKSYLIDYEYAGDNDPYFDVMSFITENTLTQDEKEEFLKIYFNHSPNQNIRHELEQMAKMHNLLWCTWAKMMAESRHSTVYLDIAYDKLQALRKRAL
jgi:thiamine kinase-like enzyme